MSQNSVPRDGRAFCPQILAAMVKTKREQQNLSLRAASANILHATKRNISIATLNRVESGDAPDLTTLCALVDWLDIPIGRLFGEDIVGEPSRSLSTAERVAHVLSEDAHLSAISRQAIVHLVAALSPPPAKPTDSPAEEANHA